MVNAIMVSHYRQPTRELPTSIGGTMEVFRAREVELNFLTEGGEYRARN